MEREYLSREPRQYTRKERLQNWFYYNKWWLVVGAIIVYVIGSMLWNVLGIGQIKPDYRFAYVGTVRLPEDCVAALEAGLASLGEDVNGDGTVAVKLTQHITVDSADLENMTYGYASEVTILADITEGESCFFLLEDPEGFQLSYQILAHLDGGIPADDDFEAMDKVFAWRDCPALTALELGTYEDAYLDQLEVGDCQELLSGLYLGRRYFYDSSMEENPEANDALWQLLTEGAIQ